MWGESPTGTWTLEVQNDGRSIVELKHWSLVLHGTKENIVLRGSGGDNSGSSVLEAAAAPVNQPPPPSPVVGQANHRVDQVLCI